MKHRIGEVKPLVGAFMTEYYAAMVYAGAKIDYKVGRLLLPHHLLLDFILMGQINVARANARKRIF